MALPNAKPASNSSIPLRKSTNRLNRETSGVLGPTEKLSAFVAILLQPLAQHQRLTQSTDSINFIDRTKVPESAILEYLDVTRLYTNIPQEREYIQLARHTTLSILKDTAPIPTRLLDKRSG